MYVPTLLVSLCSFANFFISSIHSIPYLRRVKNVLKNSTINDSVVTLMYSFVACSYVYIQFSVSFHGTYSTQNVLYPRPLDGLIWVTTKSNTLNPIVLNNCTVSLTTKIFSVAVCNAWLIHISLRLSFNPIRVWSFKQNRRRCCCTNVGCSASDEHFREPCKNCTKYTRHPLANFQDKVIKNKR